MEYEEFSADENVVLAKRVLKRKDKRSEEDCSDTDNCSRRRKKKPAPEDSDDEFIQKTCKPKNTPPVISDSDKLESLQSICKSLQQFDRRASQRKMSPKN